MFESSAEARGSHHWAMDLQIAGGLHILLLTRTQDAIEPVQIANHQLELAADACLT